MERENETIAGWVINLKPSDHGLLKSVYPVNKKIMRVWPIVAKFLFCHKVCWKDKTYKAKTWKQLKCPSKDEWIKKMRSSYSMGYYSTIKKKKIMPFLTTRMDLGDIMLNEMSDGK